MSNVLTFPRLPEQPPVDASDAFTRAHAELVDAYNAHAEALRAHEHATQRLLRAHEIYLVALEALTESRP